MASVISEVQDKENQSIPTLPAENDTKKDAKKQPEVHAEEEENVEELQYLKLIQDILDRGMRRGDRTGTGTISVFGTQQRYSLRDGTIPLLTTKRVFWKAIVGELLWFISGSTDSKKLSEKGIKIWDANGSREFLDNLGFHDRREGDLGPVYGFQWRHFGAEYRGPDVDYTGEGVDQLAQVIDTIKNDPNSRRIILSAWNPKDLDKMALPPCHSLAQFYVCDGELSCMLYQRSGDVGLGIPFNIASYSLFTHMIAFVTGLKPGDFVHTIADTHIYNNHEEPLREQIKRTPRPFPKLRFVNVENIKTIDDFTEENIVLEGYRPYPTIKMNMAV